MCKCLFYFIILQHNLLRLFCFYRRRLCHKNVTTTMCDMMTLEKWKNIFLWQVKFIGSTSYIHNLFDYFNVQKLSKKNIFQVNCCSINISDISYTNSETLFLFLIKTQFSSFPLLFEVSRTFRKWNRSHIVLFRGNIQKWGNEINIYIIVQISPQDDLLKLKFNRFFETSNFCVSNLKV